MPGSASHRAPKRIRCNRFDNQTGEALTFQHRDYRDAESCWFAHPSEPDWVRAETAITKYNHYPRKSSLDTSKRTQDSGWGAGGSGPSSLPLVPKREFPLEPTSAHETSVYPTDNTSLTGAQNAATSSSGTGTRPSTSTSKQPPIQPKSLDPTNALSKFFDIDPSQPSRDMKNELSNEKGNNSKSKWKPIAPSTKSRKSGTDTSDAGNSQQNMLSTLTRLSDGGAPNESAGADVILSGQGSNSEQCDGAGTGELYVIDEQQMARDNMCASVRFTSILQQLVSLVITRQGLAADSRDVADRLEQLSDSHTEADLDTGQSVNLNQQLRDCTTNIGELILQLLDSAEVAASEDVESLAACLKEHLAPTSSERSANMQDAELFIQAHNKAVISGISVPLAALQDKCKKTLEVVTERHRATRSQEQQRLENWSETVQKELDAVESAREEDNSAFEKALLSASEAATQASADRTGKLRRIAELDNEFGILQRDNEALVRRLNAIEDTDVEIRDGIGALCGNGEVQEIPLNRQEIGWLRDHPLARVQPDIQKVHDEGWNELLKLQREHASSQMNVLFRDFRTAMDRSNILSTLATRWIQSRLARVPAPSMQNAAT